jgi:hypothetical protein
LPKIMQGDRTCGIRHAPRGIEFMLPLNIVHKAKEYSERKRKTACQTRPSI